MRVTALLKFPKPALAERPGWGGRGCQSQTKPWVGWGKEGQAEAFEEELIAMATQLPRLSLREAGLGTHSSFLKIVAFGLSGWGTAERALVCYAGAEYIDFLTPYKAEHPDAWTHPLKMGKSEQ